MKNLNNHNNEVEGKPSIRFTIPDAPPAEQLKRVKSIREIMVTFAKVTGELDQIDLSNIDETIAKLEAKIKESE